ncbi:MAG TPA: YbjN domain-containing protein [Roseiflexaceae bacterium]|nr:YbjN domain-containing protein [Roseiflexaceae bacterium]
MTDPSPNGAEGHGGAAGEHSNGLRAYATLGRFLSDDGWFPQPLEDVHSYRMSYNGSSGDLRCYATVRVELEQFIFYAVAGVRVPEERRVAAAEFLTRANYGLRIGNFELDFADGEVRYKSSLDFEGEQLSGNLIRNAIYPAVQVMDQYLPGLLRVAFGGASPAEAIAEIEG